MKHRYFVPQSGHMILIMHIIAQEQQKIKSTVFVWEIIKLKSVWQEKWQKNGRCFADDMRNVNVVV